MAVVAGEVEWSVASNVLRVDLSTVLQKDHHDLIRQRDTNTLLQNVRLSILLG